MNQSSPQTVRLIDPLARRPVIGGLVIAAVVAALPLVAHGDELKLNGFWIKIAQVQAIDEGKIAYLTANGSEVSKDLSTLQGIRLDEHKPLAQGQKFVESKDYAKAIDAFKEVAKDADEDWLKQYVRFELLRAQTKAGRGQPALSSYFDLIKMDADGYFLQYPPIGVARKLSGKARREAAKQVRAMIGRTQDQSIRKQLMLLRQAVQAQGGSQARSSSGQTSTGKGQGANKPPGRGANGAGEGNQTPAMGTGQAAQGGHNGQSGGVQGDGSSLTLPKSVGDTPAVEFLKQGLFTQALNKAKQQTQARQNLPEHLFVEGLAQLAIAGKTGDKSTYKDAGLSFMRIVANFGQSRYAPLALLETGYVHQKIGRGDIASKLYAQAKKSINQQGGQKAYPNYYARMVNLTSQATVSQTGQGQ